MNFIAPAFIVFLLVLSFFLYPRTFTPALSGPSACQAGKTPSQYKEVSLPPVWELGNFDPGVERENFVLIREEIPVSTDLTAFCPQLYRASGTNCVHFTPYRDPAFPNDILIYPRPAAGHDYFNYLQQKMNAMFPIHEEIVYALHMDSPGNPKIYSVRPSIGEYRQDHPYEKILVVDAYQEKGRYNEVINGQAGYNHSEVFQCDAQGPLPNLSRNQVEEITSSIFFNDPENPPPFPVVEDAPSQQVVVPPQSRSDTNEQLQLEWFVLNQSQGVFGSHCKPAVYLYPPQKQLVNVKVFPAGTLTYTDPPYDLKDGWTVDAYPDGKISTTYNLQPTTYPYLYFESKVRDEVIQKPTAGWVVQSSVVGLQSSANKDWFNPLEKHFQTLLPQLGLNAVHTRDFIDYWKNALPYSPYYFVGVIDQANVDQIERLEITPKPDSVNRVRIYFERLDQPKEVETPELSALSFQSSAEDRRLTTDDQFKVVEWGGMVKNDPNHPFTCSQ